MKDNLSEIVCVVDRSGSMRALTNDVIGGINRFIEDQRKVEGDANFSLVLFDNEVDIVHDSVDINDVPLLTEDTYVVRGMTAMNDAIGMTITNLGNKLKSMKEEDRPSNVIVCIMTDGHENASKEFTNKAVKELVDHQTDKYSWEFVFMGANIDVDEAADQIGIRSANRHSFTANAIGVDMAYATLSSATRSYRS